MECAALGMPRQKRKLPSVFVLFLVLFFFVVIVIIIVISKIAVGSGLCFVIIVVIFIVGDEIEVHGMRLRNLEFGFALGATENFAFLDLIFIDIDFGGTFGTADHRCILRKIGRRVGRKKRTATLQRIIYRAI
jgi:hypothetical protein